MCHTARPYREAPGNGGGGGDAAAVAACTTTASTAQNKRCRTGSGDEGRDGEDDGDDEDDGPLQNLSAPQDGVVMLWALPIVRLVQHGLSAATDKIKSAISLFDLTAGRILALLEEKLRLAETDLRTPRRRCLLRSTSDKRKSTRASRWRLKRLRNLRR